MGPVIGITPDFDNTTNRYKIHQDYVSSITEAGGFPIILFPGASIPPFLDGIVLSGGGDIDPLLFHEEPLWESGEIFPQRDAFELTLCNAAIEQNIPLLGICRGMQVMNIALGGTIYQDIAVQTKSTLKHDQQAPRTHGTHSIFIEEPSLLFSLWQKAKITVNSYHHQAVSTVGNGFRICAKSPDGLTEAIEHTKNAFALGVQWHPEAMNAMEQKRMFSAFVKAAAEFRNSRR